MSNYSLKENSWGLKATENDIFGNLKDMNYLNFKFCSLDHVEKNRCRFEVNNHFNSSAYKQFISLFIKFITKLSMKRIST